ncbi:MAG: molybdopterin molybdotransferase MoeA [Chromatiales bacterium]|nr:molybdopterin molybdotransferase MoeA [Chromatiales bacterium]
MSNRDLPADCDSVGLQGLLSVSEALQRIRSALKPVVGFERCALRDAHRRTVALPVTSPLNVPAYINSAMDGYALNSADIPATGEITLQVTGSSFAGTPFNGTVKTGQAVRIMTGAVVPDGADTVVMQELAKRDGEQVTIGCGHKAGENVRHIGEDIAKGGVVLTPGQRIRAPELGLLASLGVAEVTVRRRLRVATFSTGDELCSIGEQPREGQIYDSNRYSLYGMLRDLGVEHIDMGVIRDDEQAISEAFESASTIADVVITSGGVSVGEADFVKQTLDRLGQVDFWKIAMKPGKPLAFGQVNGATFFGLPGNPVSVMATFYQIVQPSLRYLCGENTTQPLRLKVQTADRLKKRPGRADFQRGILRSSDNGELQVHTTGNQGSHILSSMSQANCFIILSAESGAVEPGEWVVVEPFEGLFN